jgi:hypothetical protein
MFDILLIFDIVDHLWMLVGKKVDLKYFIQEQGLKGFGGNIKCLGELDV